MKALTIKQPWAQLIVAAGKDIENRTWSTEVRGRVAIHASAKLEPSEVEAACNFMRRFIPRFSSRIFSAAAEKYPVGAIVGTVEIVGCLRQSPSPWFTGPYGFVLVKPIRLLKPIPCRGALGFWELTPELVARIEEQPW